MKDELQQNVLDAAGQKMIAGTASGGTAVIGFSLYCELLSPIIGIIGVVSGTIVSFVLLYFSWKKYKLYCKKEVLIIKMLEAKEADLKDSVGPL